MAPDEVSPIVLWEKEKPGHSFIIPSIITACAIAFSNTSLIHSTGNSVPVQMRQ